MQLSSTNTEKKQKFRNCSSKCNQHFELQDDLQQHTEEIDDLNVVDNAKPCCSENDSVAGYETKSGCLFPKV